MKTNLYHYNAHVTAVYDGDTITVDIDLGLGVWLKKQKIRLYGINTPELRGGTPETKAKGREARDWLRTIILDRDIILQTHKDKTGKYGRWLGTIYFNTESTPCWDLNAQLILNGMAVEAKY